MRNHTRIYRLGAGLLGMFLALTGQVTQAGDIIYYIPDAQGTPIAATDAQGNILWRKHYEPYGKEVNGVPDDIGYTGHEHDAETGLTYMQARYQDPVGGRFYSIDPVGFDPAAPMTFNRYSYANNNPYKFVDPDGRETGVAFRVVNNATAGKEITPPPQSPEDWAGPAIGVALTTLVAAPVAIELYAAALSNPGAVVTATELAAEAAGVTGGATLARSAGRSAVSIGEHAGESIAARSMARDFTTAERAQINRIGSETGCHTCGTTNPGTKSGNFVPDHQPPNALNSSGGAQSLYPQCLNCSREQGLEIARQLREGE